MSQNTKKELGQFYTKNAEYIIQDLLSYIPNHIQQVIDPFAGEGDLLHLISDCKKVGYDIEPKTNEIIQLDTLSTPPVYQNTDWILTNPPYLAKNKTDNKTLFNQYDVDDLYLASLKSIKGSFGGTFILPAGFFSNSNITFRKSFLEQYQIHKIYFFEEQVFSDTTYTVCSFSFSLGNGLDKDIPVIFMPEKKENTIFFSEKNNYTFGGEIFPKTPTKIKRLLVGEKPNSKIKLYAVDSGSPEGRIRLSIEEPFYGKNTDRAFATLVFHKEYNIEEQKFIVNTFNQKLEEYRAKYNSMFLSNYRNSTKHGARKRIGFEQTYNLVQQILNNNNMN